MIRLQRLHHLHLRVSNLESTERFATDFGLMPTERRAGQLYFRGSGADTYLLRVELGAEPALLGVGFVAEGMEDLHEAIRAHGASPLHALEGPGGGQAVTLRDPEGRAIHLIAGIAESVPDALPPPQLINHSGTTPRRGISQQTRPVGPAALLRLGHVGFSVEKIAECHRWYQQVLGLIPSDLIYGGTPDNLLSGFYRLNRGAQFVDHHSIVLFKIGKLGLHHASFEVQDAETQFASHRYLLRRGWESIWGVGRHPLGSHVFDLWRHPDGFRFETFTDTDVHTAERTPGLHPVSSAEMDIWSDRNPETYFA